MEAKDLLNLDLIKKIDAIAVKEARKFQRSARKPARAMRAYRARLGKDYWRTHFQWIAYRKKRVRKMKAKRITQATSINRTYANRCPKRYETYIKSKWWTERKNRYYQAHGRKCAVCGSALFISLHHIWYGDFGQEADEQLIPFCQKHHLAFHKKHGFGTNDFRKQTAEFLKSYGIL